MIIIAFVGYYTSHSIETVGKLVSAACDAGAQIFNNIAVQDVMIKVDILLKQLYDFRYLFHFVFYSSENFRQWRTSYARKLSEYVSLHNLLYCPTSHFKVVAITLRQMFVCCLSLSVCLSLCLSVSLSLCLSVCSVLSVCLG